MESKNTQLSYHYLSARDDQNANIEYHAQFIIESKDLYYNYKFARDVEGADIEAHKQVIEASGDEFYIELFSKLTQPQKILKLTK